MAHRFSVVGDSNVTRNLNKVNLRSHPLMKSSQLIPCGHLEVLSESLKSVDPSSTACLLSCLTNFFTSLSDSSDSLVSHRVKPVLSGFRQAVFEACIESPEKFFLVSPPMYRMHPAWYSDGLPEIMTLFSQNMSLEKPANLHLMPSFPTPCFEPDGVHLTAYSGLEFVIHLFDSAQELLENQSLSTPDQLVKSLESTRALEDRMMALEQDHRRLVKNHELKSAIDAELHDWRLNERFEDFFVLKGLAPLPSTGLGTKEWQERAMRDVQGVMKILMGKEMPIVFIQNSTVKGKDAVTTYHVQTRDVSVSKEIHLKFSDYFTNKKGDTRPASLKPLSIRNRVTQETHVRISILHLFGQRYTASNQGSSYKVIGYLPRPQLKLFPATDATDRRVKSFTFIEAIKTLPKNFTAQETKEIIKRIPAKFIGKLRSLFVVLSDDQARSRLRSFKTANPGASVDTDESVAPDLDAAASGGASGPEAHTSTNTRKRPPSPLTSKKSKKNNKA